MNQLTTAQRSLLDAIVADLSEIDGIEVIVLGGSHARGRATPASDLDLGLYYEDAAPPSIPAIRSVAEKFGGPTTPTTPTTTPTTVTDLWEWGPWVNGGAWIQAGEQPVDFLYRSLDQQSATIDAAERGEYELHFAQQPPFGFFGPTLLGELHIAQPLHDPKKRLAPLKARVATYPEPLRRRVLEDFLWSAEFTLGAFARKAVARGDAYLTMSLLARAAHALTLALFALNETYLVNDKTAVEEIESFANAPSDFRRRFDAAFFDAASSEASASADRLDARMEAIEGLVVETIELAGDFYMPKWRLRGR